MGRHAFKGGCHCGGIAVEFACELMDGSVEATACPCSFCRLHDVRLIAAPGGEVTVALRQPGHAYRYRFGLRTADYLVCRRCGVFVCALASGDTGTTAAINVHAFADVEPLVRVRPIDEHADGTDPEERLAVRLARWTPARVVDFSETAPAAE